MSGNLITGMQVVGVLTQFDDTIIETAEYRGIVAPRAYVTIHIVPEGIGIGSVSLGVGAVGKNAYPGDIAERSDTEVGHGLVQILSGHFYRLVAVGCLLDEGEILCIYHLGSIDVVASLDDDVDGEQFNLVVGNGTILDGEVGTCFETCRELTHDDGVIYVSAIDGSVVTPLACKALHIVPEAVEVGIVLLGIRAIGLDSEPCSIVDRRDAEVRDEFVGIEAWNGFGLVAIGCLGLQGEFLGAHNAGNNFATLGSLGADHNGNTIVLIAQTFDELIGGSSHAVTGILTNVEDFCFGVIFGKDIGIGAPLGDVALGTPPVSP